MATFDETDRDASRCGGTSGHVASSEKLNHQAGTGKPGGSTLMELLVPQLQMLGTSPSNGAAVQRKEDGTSNRTATREAATIDAPAEVEETRSTLPIDNGASGSAAAGAHAHLDARQLAHAHKRNVLEWHRLRFDERAFCDAHPG